MEWIWRSVNSVHSDGSHRPIMVLTPPFFAPLGTSIPFWNVPINNYLQDLVIFVVFKLLQLMLRNFQKRHLLCEWSTIILRLVFILPYLSSYELVNYQLLTCGDEINFKSVKMQFVDIIFLTNYDACQYRRIDQSDLNSWCFNYT